MGMFREVEKAQEHRAARCCACGATCSASAGLLVGIDRAGDRDHARLDLLGPYLMGMAIDSYISQGDLPGLARLLG